MDREKHRVMLSPLVEAGADTWRTLDGRFTLLLVECEPDTYVFELFDAQHPNDPEVECLTEYGAAARVRLILDRESKTNRHALATKGDPWWTILGPGATEGTWTPDVDVDPNLEFFDLRCDDDCQGCMCRTGLHHVNGIRSPWGNEYTNPTAWCRDRWCKSTNWGGRGRLHRRGNDCPPFNFYTVQFPDPEQLIAEGGQDAGIKRVNP